MRAALASGQRHTARKARIEDGDQRYQIYANDQANTADDYRPLIIAYRNGAPVRLSDVGRSHRFGREISAMPGLANGKPAVLMILYRQPGANIIETVDRVKALLPQLQASTRPATSTSPSPSTARRRSAPSLHDVEMHADDRDRSGDPGGLRVPAQRRARR